MKRSVATERAQYDALLQRLSEISVSDDIGDSLIQVVDLARPPLLPFKPNKILTLLLVALTSSLAGVVLVFGIELIDDRIKAPDDIKEKLKSVLMAVIPYTKTPENLIADMSNPQAKIAEAYASLRSNLQFSGPEGGPKVIQITSTRSGEGKSVSSLGVAFRYAGLGGKVLLIDCDLRLPTFVQGEGETVGLSGLLTSLERFEDNIQKSRFENLDFLPSGSTVPNPSELLSGDRFIELISFARDNYSYVIVDSPPVLGLADACIIGARVDATLLVVEAAQLRTPNIKMTIERLTKSGTKLLGVVLTKYKVAKNTYQNYYTYSYGEAGRDFSLVPKKEKTKAFLKKQKLEIA